MCNFFKPLFKCSLLFSVFTKLWVLSLDIPATPTHYKDLEFIHTCDSRFLDTKKNNGSFLHITDIHVDPLYRSNTDPHLVCHWPSTEPKDNIAGKYGALGSRCDSSVRLVEETFLHMKSQFREVDFIIYTGDTARHNRDNKMPRIGKDALSDHLRVAKYFEQTFNLSKTLLIPTIGNNDVLWHNKLVEKAPLFEKLLNFWSPFKGLDILTKGSAQDTFLLGGYWLQSLPHSPKVKVINLNSMLFYIANKKLKDCDHPDSAGGAQLVWYERTLIELKKNKKRAYVMGHVPPRDEHNNIILYEECYNKLIHITGKYSDTIISLYWGHTNFDTISVITRNQRSETFSYTTLTGKTPNLNLHGDIVAVTTTGPSIIPVHHPSLRHYIYEPGSGDLMGYTQYYTNLTTANKLGTLQFLPEYSTWDEYQLPSLTLRNWRRFLPILINNETLWSIYLKFQTVGSDAYLHYPIPDWNDTKTVTN